MNKLTIIGNLTRDPDSRQVGDKTVCNFTIAVNRRKKVEGQPEADFFRVAAWGKTGENCQKFLTKGRKVAVVGSVSVSTYTAQDGSTRASMDVHAEDVEFLSSTNNSGDTAAVPAEASEPAVDPSGATVVTTDDLPFERGLAYP